MKINVYENRTPEQKSLQKSVPRVIRSTTGLGYGRLLFELMITLPEHSFKQRVFKLRPRKSN